MPAPFIYQIAFISFAVSFCFIVLFSIIRAIRLSLFYSKYLDALADYPYVGNEEIEVMEAERDTSEASVPAREDSKLIKNIIEDIEKTTSDSKEDSFLIDWWNKFDNVIAKEGYKVLLLSCTMEGGREKDMEGSREEEEQGDEREALAFNGINRFKVVRYNSFSVDTLSEIEKKLNSSSSSESNILEHLILQKRSLYFKGSLDLTKAFMFLFSENEHNKYKHLYIFPIFDKGVLLGSLILIGSDESLSIAYSIVEILS